MVPESRWFLVAGAAYWLFALGIPQTFNLISSIQFVQLNFAVIRFGSGCLLPTLKNNGERKIVISKARRSGKRKDFEWKKTTDFGILKQSVPKACLHEGTQTRFVQNLSIPDLKETSRKSTGQWKRSMDRAVDFTLFFQQWNRPKASFLESRSSVVNFRH